MKIKNLIRKSLREKHFWYNLLKFKNIGCFGLLIWLLFSGQIIREFGWYSIYVFIVITIIYFSGFTDGYEVNNK